MMRGLALSALLLLACGARPATAGADKCSILATNIVFGNYTGATRDVTGTLTVNCTNNTRYAVGLNAGMASGATVTNRSMTGPASALLGYGLFSNAGYTSNWGNTVGVDTVAGTGDGADHTLTVYGRIPANEYAAPGSYTDTITASVTGQTTNPATVNFSVRAAVPANCAISANALNFGTYSGSLINAASTITITCTDSTTYNVGLDAGVATGATVTSRKMTGPASALLGYKLFRNSGRTINWGNTVGTDTMAGTGTGLAQSLTVYGQIPAGASALPGSYADTITATVTY